MYYPENTRHSNRVRPIDEPRFHDSNNATPSKSLRPVLAEMQPRVVNKWDKFVLLMWKNWLLVRRQKLQTVLEITIPVIFSALLVLIRGLSDPEVYPAPFDYQPLSVVNNTWNRWVTDVLITAHQIRQFIPSPPSPINLPGR